MESGYKFWDEILKTIHTLASGPIVVLCFALLARRWAKKQGQEPTGKQ